MFKNKIPTQCDAIIIGSGGAGLVSALTIKSFRPNWSVWVAEKTDNLGGATSYSGGVCWLPGNRFQKDPEKDAEQTQQYIKNAYPEIDNDCLDGFIHDAPRTLDFLISKGVQMEPIEDYPDYYQEIEGASMGHSIAPPTYQGPKAIRSVLRKVPFFFPPFTMKEILEWGPHRLGHWNKTLLAKRKLAGHQTMGRALIGFLAEACLNSGVEIALNCQTEGLLIENARTKGVVINGRRVNAPLIVMACGGFSHNPDLMQQLNLKREILSAAPEACDTGGGLALALDAGLKTGNPYCWWMPLLKIYAEGEEKPGPDLWAYHTVLYDRTWPSGIMVNAAGKRFTNEAACYNTVGGILAMDEDPLLDRVWLIWGKYYIRHYIRGVVSYLQPAKPYMNKSKSLNELAAKTELPTETLKETIDHWNNMARQGKDFDFHRGESIYDQYMGDRFRSNHPNIGPVEPPFQAVRIHPGCLGTKMGPVTDEYGRVHLEDGRIVSGLYATGNAAASFLGNIYPGAGATLGQACVCGYRTGKHATGYNNDVHP